MTLIDDEKEDLERDNRIGKKLVLYSFLLLVLNIIAMYGIYENGDTYVRFVIGVFYFISIFAMNLWKKRLERMKKKHIHDPINDMTHK